MLSCATCVHPGLNRPHQKLLSLSSSSPSRGSSPLNRCLSEPGSAGAAVRPGCDPEPVRSFWTFTTDLHCLADWFAQCRVKTVAMESTGVYWIPLYEILDQRGFEVVVVNARDAKHVPGRKTD